MVSGYADRGLPDDDSAGTAGSSGSDDGESYGRELRRKAARNRRIRTGVAIGAVTAVILAVIAFYLWLRFYRYTEYQVNRENQLNEGSLVGFELFDENVIKYSHDGASYIDASGREVWVDSFEMKSPMICVNGDYAVVADTEGNRLNIYDRTGKIGSGETLLPITKAAVSGTGVCACVIEDNNASYITFFSKDGTELDITIKSVLAGDGYPVDIALSPSGTQLMVAYEYLDNLQFRSRIVFYDFSEIGKNIPNRLVGGFEDIFDDSFAGRVRYIDAVYSYTVTDKGLTFFSSRNLASPELVKEVPVEGTIESVFNYEGHVGYVMRNTESGGEESHVYKLVILNEKGDEETVYEFDQDFRNVSADEKYIYIIATSRLSIVNKHGVTKYDGPIGETPREIRATAIPWRFILTGNGSERSISFK